MSSLNGTWSFGVMKIWIVMSVAAVLFATGHWAWGGTNEPAGDHGAENGTRGNEARAETDPPWDNPGGEGKPEAVDLPAEVRAGLEVVARVNGDPVTRVQLTQMVGNPITLSQARKELGVEAPDRKELERVAMKRLIHLCLLVQEAVRRRLTVSQDELDQTVSAISHRFESLKDFGNWMKDQGLNDPWLFGTVRTDLLAERATEALAAEASVTEEEAQQYFEAHREDLIIGTEVRLRIIAVETAADAEEIAAELKSGAPFDILARRRSQGRLAAKGGDTGWVNLRTLPSLLQQVVVGLEPGKVTGPIEKAKDQFLIVGLQNRRPILAKNLAEARLEIERRLLPSKQQNLLQKWLEAQEQKANIELLRPTAGLLAEGKMKHPSEKEK